MEIRKIVKKIIPSFLLNYIVALRKRFQVIRSIQLNKRNLYKINSRQRKDRITIVFICQLPSLWNSLRSVYSEALENRKVNTYLVAIPEKIVKTNYNVRDEEYCDNNESYSFLQSLYGNVINGYNPTTKRFQNLLELDPDYVFLPRPYDLHLPPEYRSGFLSKFTRVCFINYGFNITRWSNTVIYEILFIKNVYALFPESLDAQQYLNRLLQKYKCTWNKVFYEGYPRFDLIDNNFVINTKKQVFLWMPRWTTDTSLLGSHFFEYKEKFFSFFAKNKNLTLIFRPHPLMIRNFISTGEMNNKDLKELENIFNENENIILDTDDYLSTFSKCDALIADPTSLLVEYFFTKKPIVYCGDTDSFNSATTFLIDGLYIANSWNDILDNINLLSTGIDKKYDLRCSIINDNFSNSNVGRKIVQTLISDYYGCCE